MIIPSRLNKILERNDKLKSIAHSAISIIKPWFEDNKLVFFPEYTDHGPKHIQEVMDTVEAIIAPAAWEILGPEDIATLILGILLHDCAMHLSEDGFVTLISKDRPCNEAFKDKPWRQLWQEFMAEARRFDERKLTALFDDIAPVQEPPLDPLQMKKKDRLLIGEFLRRHHPRLAHEIALMGIPGPQGDSLLLGNIPDDTKDLAGVVARSHGLDLRVCVDYFNKQSRWGARRTTGVHVTYLMALVRIADYIQIHSERAPQEILKIRSLKSPVSRGEWNAHAAIKDIHQETDDPEALWIEARPQDVKIFLKLKHLLLDIQRELDDCWAILGEVYGSRQELRNLGLTLRRIKSNLDDVETFSKTVQYVPRRATLETGGADLLKLLIKPLYGDNPQIGIRELLQNAVDACRELEDYLQKHSDLRDIEFQEQAADVVIALEAREDGTKVVTISDKGIGMTVDTLLNYFLKAGASFRNSDAWRKQHEDEEGNVRVLRSGRFGVGVLAGFLLGDEIQVSTRHVTADEGIAFTCKLIDEAIELTRVTRLVGTTIQIQISDDVFSKLSAKDYTDDLYIMNEVKNYWDWYCLKNPSVLRMILPEGERLKQRFEIPNPGSQLPPRWRRIQHPDFLEIHWSQFRKAPALTCNGIIIESVEFHGYRNRENIEEFRLPNISAFDPYGNLPINLQRTDITVLPEQLPFKNQLLEDMARDFIAYLIVNSPDKSVFSSRTHKSYFPDKNNSLSVSSWYWCGVNGISLVHSWHLQELDVSRLFIIPSSDVSQVKDLSGNFSFYPFMPVFGDKSQLFEHTIGSFSRYNLPPIQARYFITRNKLDEVRGSEADGFYNLPECIEELSTDKWVLLRSRDCPPIDQYEERLYTLDEDKLFPFSVIYAPADQRRDQMPNVAKAWREFIQLPYIPYDLKERREKLSFAYKELASYIKAWELLKERKERAAVKAARKSSRKKKR